MTVFDIIEKRITEEEDEARKYASGPEASTFKYWCHLQMASGLREALTLFENEMERQAREAIDRKEAEERRRWTIPQSLLV